MIDHDHGEKSHLPITILVSPSAGRLRILPPETFQRGAEWLEKGQAVLRIERGPDADLIRSPARGRLGGVLGRDGEIVKQGQAVAWMEPA
jgi:biotin carboxyl carrier protein